MAQIRMQYARGSKKAIRLYLYKNGNQCIETTNGWAFNRVIVSDDNGFVRRDTDTTFETNYINSNGIYFYYSAIHTNNLIDLTKYTKLFIETSNYQTTGGNTQMIFYLSTNPEQYMNAIRSINSNGILAVDITNFTGHYSICFANIQVSGNSTVRIHNIWLEK